MKYTITNFLNFLGKKKKIVLFSTLALLITLQTQAADFYWVGGTGNWSDFATHWATTSGGATFHANAPTATDNVFFDVNSGAAGYTVTLDVAATSADFSYTGNSFSFDGTNSLVVDGTVTHTSTQVLTYGGGNDYTFTGNYNAAAGTTTEFTTTGTTVNIVGSVTIGNGSTFSFSPSATTTIDGAFNSTTVCSTANTINSTGGAASVVFNTTSTWTNTNVENINATGTVTLESGSLTTSTGITDNTVNRNLFWVGGTGNWNDESHWSLTSGGAGGECIPTATDDVNFDANSGLAGGTVTINVAAPVRNFNYDVASATITASNSLTVNGTTVISQTINFNGASTYTFTGDFTANAASIVNISNTTTTSFSNVAVGLGGTFRFSDNGAGANTTVSGTFTPTGTCSNPVILSATGGFTAPVNFANPQTWSGVDVSQINSTGANVTVNSISVVVTGNFTDNTTAGRTLYWVGGTGNWSDETHWSLTSGGTGGECIPNLVDDVFFDANSFSAAGQIVTIDIDGTCQDMDWTGVTNNPTLTGAAAIEFTLTGTLTFVAGMNQTGLAPTFEGTMIFSSNTPQNITMNGKGLNNVRFQTAAAGEWTFQDAFLAQNQLLLNSGTLNTGNQNVTAGRLSTNNILTPTRVLNLGSSAITLTNASTTVLDYRNDANFTLNSGTSTITISGNTTTIETATLAKTISNLVYTGAGNRTINTGSDVNIITFGDITTGNGGQLNINGTSPKFYNNITIGSSVTSVINGTTDPTGNFISSIITGNTGTTTFNGGYQVGGTTTTGNTSTLNFVNTGGENEFADLVTIGIGSNFNVSGDIDNTFADITLLDNATATFNTTPAGSTNFIDNINMNIGTTFAFSSVALNVITGTINTLGSCSSPITLTSNNPPNQARLQLATTLDLFGATVQNINATAQPINVSDGTISNNTNVTGNTISRDLYWVHSVAGAGTTGNWYDAANWSATSGGAGGECPPTIYDNVFFDANSFSAAGQIVDMDADAFCRNMDWTGVVNDPLLQSIGEDTDLTVGGNLTFVAGMTVGTGGTNPNDIRDIYFAATNAIPSAAATTNNTIDWGIGTNETANGKRFQRAFFNQNKEMAVAGTATWTLASAFNLTQEVPLGRLTLQNGEINTADFNMQVRILDANGADGALDIGNSEITLRATGLTFDFRNDTNFNFINPGANAQFILTSGGGNVQAYTGSEQKELPDIIVTANNNVTINTDNGADRITFRNIDLQDTNVLFNLTGTSPKTYSEDLSFNDGINATFNGGTAPPDANRFQGNVTFATNSQANFIGENQFQGTFDVTGTTGTGIIFTGTGRNRFNGDVTIGAGSTFSLQNTSGQDNVFNNVTLSNSVVFEFTPNANNTVNGNFVAIADCTTDIVIRSSSAGNVATVDFVVAQNWENTIVTDINNIGATVTVLSGTDGGNNTNITFNIITRTLYWVHNGNPLAATGASTIDFTIGNWNDPNNWSLTSGGQTGECPPTLQDDVFFDANSFGGNSQIVNIDVDAEARDLIWTGSTGTPVFTGTPTFNLQVGGSLTFIAAMNHTFAGDVLFRNTNTGTNTIISDGQTFNGNVIFYDNTLGTGIWQLGDNFITAQTFNLVDGTFTTTASNYQLTARILDVYTIANGIGSPTRELNLNGSTTNVTLNNGLAVDFRGNTANFVLNSTAASQLRLLGNADLDMEMGSVAKTIPNIQIVNTGVGNIVTIESSNIENNANRITFRDITAFQDGLEMYINGNAPKTYGAITFPNDADVDFRGVDNALPLRNEFNGAINFGQNTNADWYDDNTFDAPINIASTINNANAVRHYEDNLFTTNAPVTFSAIGRARWRIGGGGAVNVFQAPVNMLGTPNRLEFLGSNTTTIRFESTLFVESSITQQSYVEADCRPDFRDDVEFGDGAGGNNTAPLLFRLGVDFTNAPAGTTLTTGIDSRLIFDQDDVSVIRDMNVGENTVLTFNNDLTIDNMNLSRFDVVNFPNSNPVNVNDGTTTVNGFIVAREGCAGWINIRSNLTGEQAQIDFQTAHTGTNGFLYTFIQDIWNNDLDGSGLQVVEADPATVSDVGNNTNITFINAQPARDFYWVRSNNNITFGQNSSGDWNGLGDDNHWSIGVSGGPASGCIPTANDNVFFDDNSFSEAGVETVNIDNFFSYCKNMSWTASDANRGRLIGDNAHTVQVFGNLLFADFASDRDWNDFPGLFEFKGTSIGEAKTIESRGSRFNGNVEFDAPYDDWTLVDSMRINGNTRGNLTINYGDVFANDQNIRLDHNWTINTPTGTLPQGRFIAGTGTVTFYDDDNADITINDFQTGAACSECTDPVALTGCSGSPFYNLTIEKRYDRRTELNTTISVYNNFHIVEGYFEDDGFQIRGNTTGTVYMADNTLLRLGLDNRATTFPTCYDSTNVILANGTADGFANNDYDPDNPTSFPLGTSKASIVEYRCPDPQLIRGLTYGTLYLRSEGTGNDEKRFTGTATIEGDFFIDDNQRVRDMGFQITGNDFATGNRFRMDNNAALYLGTAQNATENTYPIATGFEPDGITFPPTNTQVAVDYGATNVVPDNISTKLPKFTNTGELDDIVTGGKMDLRNTSYIIYSAGSAQEVAAGFTYSVVRLRATGQAAIIPKTIVRENLLSDAEMRVGRELGIETFNSLIDDGNQIVGVGTPDLAAQANTQLILGNNLVATRFPTVFVRSNISLDPDDHETIYNADLDQIMSTEPEYGNLTLTAPNLTLDAMVDKVFTPDPTGENAGLTADIFGNLIINERNHLIDEGNQITGLASKFVTMNSDVPNQGRSWLTLGTNGGTDVATQFPLNFGTVTLNDSTTVVYNAGSSVNQSVRGFNGGATGTDSYYNLIAQSGGENNADKLLQAETRVRNNFFVLDGSRFRDEKHQITGNLTADLVGAGLLWVEDEGQLWIGRNTTAGGLPTEFPLNFDRTRIDLEDNSTIRYLSRTAQVQQVSAEPVYGNIYLDAGHGVPGAGALSDKSIEATPVSITRTALEIKRDLFVDIRVRFNDEGVQIQGNTPRNLTIEENSELVLGTATQATLFPTNFERGNTDLHPNEGANTTTVIYNSSVVGNNIAGGNPAATATATETDNPIYGNVILRSAGGGAITKNLLGSIDINGDLTIEDDNTLEVTASDFTINLAENWTCQTNGVFNSQEGRVILDGTTEQQLTTNAQGFYELEASSTGGSFRMMDDITIKTGGQTIFNTGLFIPDDIALGTSSTRKMIFEENATVGGSGVYSVASWVSLSAPALSADGPSDVSHVVGKVEKQGADAFMFPIGNGTNYAPAGLSARSSSSASFEARYVGPRLPTVDGYDVSLKEPTIVTISNLEYWLIDRLASSDAATVYLSWDNPRSAAYQPEGLLVARWDNATPIWQDKFNGGYTNASAKGVIASQAPVTDFSPFTLGSNTNFNPLPLDLLAFDATVDGESVRLDWQTTNEIDNSHFMVERSQDGESFATLGRVNAKGKGLEGTFDYQFWDAEPFDGRSYYRLQMFDLNGTFKYSPVRSILFENEVSGVQGEMSLYPNPNGGARFYLNLDGKLTTDAQIEVVDMIGRTVHTQNVEKGAANIIISPTRVLKAGTYILRFVTPQETITKKFVVE